ncbi:MAG TPA: hypothetical protein P5056_02270 [Candidatus Paceibacterota bacterium]|nr:hypothetical protein [Candidatus Paceibacterota bacterium]
MHEQLVSFIEEYLKKGSTKEEIKSVLMRVGGWTEQEVAESFAVVDSKRAPAPQSLPTPPMPSKPPVQTPPSVTPPRPAMPSFQPPRPSVTGFQTSSASAQSLSPRPTMPPYQSPIAQKPPIVSPAIAYTTPTIAEPMKKPPVTQVYAMPAKAQSSSGALLPVLISSVISAALGVGATVAYFTYIGTVPVTIPMQIETKNVVENTTPVVPSDIQEVATSTLPVLPQEELPASSTVPAPANPVSPVQPEAPFVND